MVLKDWKTNGASKIAQRWDNKKIDSYITIFARNPVYPNGSGIVDLNHSAWSISIFKDNEIVEQKTFSGRPQALTFAKSYMRKH